MSNQDILRSVKEEYAVYRSAMIQAGAEKIWECSGEVTAWRYIEDYLEGMDDEGQNVLLKRLYKAAGAHILSTLVKRYMKSEGYDIGSWDGIRNLVLDYLEYRE